MSEAHALMRAFNQTGNVGQDKRSVEVDLHLSQIWELGGERIVGYFGLRTRQTAQQGALACVWLADQTYVRDYFQFQGEQPLLAFLAGRPFSRRLIGGRFEVGISLATFAATSGDELLVR